jgi:DMSO/TMAO reductase YedYZ heme-binding membrane subunit
VTGFLAVLHFLWLVKADHSEPLIYLAIFGALMLLRIGGRRASGVGKSVRS